MNWKTLWKKYHNTNIKWHSVEEHPTEGIDTIRFYLAHLELNLITQAEVVDWFRRAIQRSFIRDMGMDTLYTTFADELEMVKMPPPEIRQVRDDPYAPIIRAMLLKTHEYTGMTNRGLIVDLQFLRGVYTQWHLRPDRFVFALYPSGTWIGERDDQNTDSMLYSKAFQSWIRATRESEHHAFIVDIPRSGYILSEVEPWQAYRFLVCDPGMSKADAEGCVAR